MDAVLGLSVTPSAVGLILVEGQDADGATMDRDAFEIPPWQASSALQTSEQAAAAVLRTEAIAANRGHRLHSIGITWSDDADTEAALLLKSLADCGFDNVVPVRLPEATEALAWGIADVIGYDITAVCAIEPDTVIAIIVHTRDGAVQTAVNHTIDSEEELFGWLSAVFTRADWRPEALVGVGSGGDLEALMPRLEDVLSVPVYAPAEADLALARGAALASAHTNDVISPEHIGHAPARHSGGRRWPAEAGPLAMLAAGAVTFVVSVSVAVSMEITPQNDTTPAEPRPAAKTSPEAAAAADPVPSALSRPESNPVPIAATPLAPPPQAPPAEQPAPPSAVDVAAAPPVDGLAPAAPIEPAPPEAFIPPAPGVAVDALPPGAAIPPAPGLVPAEPTPVPEQRPGILRRIRDRLSDIGPEDQAQPAPAMVPAPGAPPPEAPAALPPPDVPPAPEAVAAPPPEALPAPAPPDAPPLPPPPDVPPLPPPPDVPPLPAPPPP